MGLVARHLEANGIPTVTFSCARDITEAVRPPRSVFLDYPLGSTCGRPHDRANQRAAQARPTVETTRARAEAAALLGIPQQPPPKDQGGPPSKK